MSFDPSLNKNYAHLNFAPSHSKSHNTYLSRSSEHKSSNLALVRVVSCIGERTSRPLVSFGVLIDNMIKGLTCLHEIMSRDLIQDLILNKVTHVLQANVYIPLASLYMRQAKL